MQQILANYSGEFDGGGRPESIDCSNQNSSFSELKDCQYTDTKVVVPMERFMNQIMSPEYAVYFDVYIVGDRDATVTLVEKSSESSSGQYYDIGKGFRLHFLFFVLVSTFLFSDIGADNNTKIVVRGQEGVVGDANAYRVLCPNSPKKFNIKLRQGTSAADGDASVSDDSHSIRFQVDT